MSLRGAFVCLIFYSQTPNHGINAVFHRGTFALMTWRHTYEEFGCGLSQYSGTSDWLGNLATDCRRCASVSVEIAGLSWFEVPELGPEPGYTDFHILMVPWWMLLGATGLLALWRIWAFWRKRQQRLRPGFSVVT
jgi:hypothetical protein